MTKIRDLIKREVDTLEKARCPICGGWLLGGPSGGGSINTMCSKCCTEYWFSGWSGYIMPRDKSRMRQVYGLEPIELTEDLANKIVNPD